MASTDPRPEPRVVIVGAGPAGLVTAWLLHRAGVPFLLLEASSRHEIGARPKAGIVEHRTVELLRAEGIAGVALHFDAENRSVEFRSPAASVHLDYAALTGGRPHAVFPQHRLVAELAAALVEDGAPLHFGHRVAEVSTDGAHPRVVGKSLSHVPGCSPTRLLSILPSDRLTTSV